jgi:hypothetical protein
VPDEMSLHAEVIGGKQRRGFNYEIAVTRIQNGDICPGIKDENPNVCAQAQ